MVEPTKTTLKNLGPLGQFIPHIQGFEDPDCPFVHGSCPVTLDNVIDVFFYDIVDQASCQHQCKVKKQFTITSFSTKWHPKVPKLTGKKRYQKLL